MRSLGDQELMAQWMAGNREAAAILCERHFASVNRFFRNKVSTGHEDLVQKTFLLCIERHADFRGEGLFKTYLLGIAHNVLRRHYRQLSRQLIVWTEVCAVDASRSASSHARWEQDRTLLLEGLRRIPLEFQLVLELYYWEELSARAIAQITGLTVPNVRNRIRVGKARLEAQILSRAKSLAELQQTLGDLALLERELSTRGGAPDHAEDRVPLGRGSSNP